LNYISDPTARQGYKLQDERPITSHTSSDFKKSTLFSDIMRRRVEIFCRRFGTIYRSHL